MSTTIQTKEQQLAIEYFEHKLAFEVGPFEVAHALEGKERVQIIDLRTPEIYAKGHVPGAVNVSLEQLEQHASKLDPNVNTVVYCYNITCHLSAKAALLLAKKGFKVRELIGGFEEWANRELKVEQKGGGGIGCACG